ncbi:MAG: preprotein translocase subunit SecG [Candidatus Woesebacteria bacterium]|jgi:preprotein translocase subunit SecG
MQNYLPLIQILLSVLIIGLILLQAQGSGFGSSWSGGGETYHTRRGVEKLVFYLSIVAIILFTFSSIALVLI